ncbi:hypothetical protein CEXT_572631 [Caerostris extrusa]|uniref:Uncharacterized protein n=1 Tax=Caerostris extrusa TaxID=172846 RepID=A0AAV4XQ55_CAEEX|nr:hypothetical protein CEXT_572631 [Caerostris extrusa]
MYPIEYRAASDDSSISASDTGKECLHASVNNFGNSSLVVTAIMGNRYEEEYEDLVQEIKEKTLIVLRLIAVYNTKQSLRGRC